MAVWGSDTGSRTFQSQDWAWVPVVVLAQPFSWLDGRSEAPGIKYNVRLIPVRLGERVRHHLVGVEEINSGPAIKLIRHRGEISEMFLLLLGVIGNAGRRN